MNTTIRQSATSNSSFNTFMNSVYLWMVAGFAVSAVCASYIISHPQLLQSLINSGSLTWTWILQLAAVLAFPFLARKQNPTINTALYMVYAVLTSFTLSVLALVYTSQSIAMAFASTAIAFLGLSVFGRLTKRDLSGIGTFCVMGCWGLIGVGLLSFFVPALRDNTAQLVMSSMGVIVFSGLTAWENQRLRQSFAIAAASGNNSAVSALAISGALTLYINFIGLFFSLLRLTGGRR